MQKHYDLMAGPKYLLVLDSEISSSSTESQNISCLSKVNQETLEMLIFFMAVCKELNIVPRDYVEFGAAVSEQSVVLSWLNVFVLGQRSLLS